MRGGGEDKGLIGYRNVGIKTRSWGQMEGEQSSSRQRPGRQPRRHKGHHWSRSQRTEEPPGNTGWRLPSQHRRAERTSRGGPWRSQRGGGRWGSAGNPKYPGATGVGGEQCAPALWTSMMRMRSGWESGEAQQWGRCVEREGLEGMPRVGCGGPGPRFAGPRSPHGAPQ